MGNLDVAPGQLEPHGGQQASIETPTPAQKPSFEMLLVDSWYCHQRETPWGKAFLVARHGSPDGS